MAARQIDERMADELHVDAGVPVEGFLERKDHQHARHVTLHRPHASGPPRPQLRADVVDDRHAEPTHGSHQPEVEIGKIDGDEDVRPVRPRALRQPPDHRQRSRDDANGLGEAGDRELPEVAEQARAGGAQTRPAEPGDLRLGLPAKDLGGQRPGVQIAGRFTAGDQDPHRSHFSVLGARFVFRFGSGFRVRGSGFGRSPRPGPEP
jgi:hypothetical protein